MKKLSLVLSMALVFTTMYARADRRPVRHRLDEPVKVVVRGIEFFVFPNGEFDFNAHTTHHKPYYGGDYAVRLDRDRWGRIRRIGNVFLNYNDYGQVARIGHVFIKYNRRGLIYQIGHKYLRYRRGGYIVYAQRPYYDRPSYIYRPAYSYYPYQPTYPYNDTYYSNDYDEAYNETSEVYYLRNKKDETTGTYHTQKVKVKNRR